MTHADDVLGARASDPDHRWVIVLAGGSGERLATLTRSGGVVVPKQYCSFRGSRSLLGDAMARARALAPPEHIVVVVARQHERYWRRSLRHVDPEQIVVQPANRGTAPGVLLPLSSILERDSDAVVTLLPSDHFVAEEHELAHTLRDAQCIAAHDRSHTVLIGIEPENPECEYGWIEPDRSRAREVEGQTVLPVANFVEKPDLAKATLLRARGAVWNSFLIVARGEALLALIEERLPALVGAFTRFAPHASSTRAEWLYQRLSCADLSRDVLASAVPRLRVLIAPACGWTDLGTPDLVMQCLRGWSAAALPSVRRATTPNLGARVQACQTQEADPAAGSALW